MTYFDLSPEDLLLRARMGDEVAQIDLYNLIHSMKRPLIAAALVGTNFNLNDSDKEYVFEVTYSDVCRTYEFQHQCPFLSYFPTQLKYGYQNYFKTLKTTQIQRELQEAQSTTLNDITRSDVGVSWDSVPGWVAEVEASARKTHRLSERDLSIGLCHLLSMKFKDIAKKFHLSESAVKKVWRKYLNFVIALFSKGLLD